MLLLAPIRPLAMAIFGAARDFTRPSFAPAKPPTRPSLALQKKDETLGFSESHSPGNSCKWAEKLSLESSKGLDDVVLLLPDRLKADCGGGGGGVDGDCHHYQQHQEFQRHRDWLLQHIGVEFGFRVAQISVKRAKRTNIVGECVFACLGVFSGTSLNV